MPNPFVSYGGSQLALQPPYFAENVSLYAFLIEADIHALQAMLDRRLNHPFGPKRRFVPEGSLIMVVFNKIGKMYSENPADRKKGWFSEQEAAIWVRVADTEREKSFWFHPYMFVDNSYAMALGREVYGFPKAIGWFDIPDTPRGATKFSAETLVLLTFDPETQGVRIPLIEARRTSAVGWPRVGVAFDFLAEITGVESPGGDPLGKLELILTSIADLENLEVPMVFLKQFPSGDQPGVACLQTGIETTAIVTKVHHIEYMTGEWQIQIAHAASHPIVEELGLAGPAPNSVFQFWANFDMSVGYGYPVATASEPATRKKIAILGGGVGGIATALELTAEPDWQSRYEVTVYQTGWRLGGKGASGRGENGRIEEHGLHIWLGFYENAFRLIQSVYEENKKNRQPGTPLREWFEAFKKHNAVALMDRREEQQGERWMVWPIETPEFPGTPGDGEPLTWSDSFIRLWGWLEELYLNSTFHARANHAARESPFWPKLTAFFHHLIPGIEPCDLNLATQILKIGEIARTMGSDPRLSEPEHQQNLAVLIGHFRDSFRQKIKGQLGACATEFHRLYEVVELATAITKGLLECGYFLDHSKLDTLTDELQDWLAAQGADPAVCHVKGSCILRGLYDLVFAYRNGEVAQASFEAGVAIRCILLIMGSYKGSIFWKMQAGMGDVVFAPMYEVLRERGVKFEFFNRVENLALNAEGTAIESVRIGVQATMRDPTSGYEPLMMVEGLPCWPSQSRLEQLVEGDQIAQGGYDLESFWTTWQNPAEKTLQAGRDFDQVVLAISLGAIPFLFSEKTSLPEPFCKMLANVETVRTQALQLWVRDDLETLGWEGGSVVLDAYTDPINTWAVMDHLLVRESWPEGSVKTIHYFCGQMEGGIPPRSEARSPRAALDETEAACEKFMKQAVPLLMPKLAAENVVSRYVRANLDPSERYVLSVAGSTQFRLRANESGLDNLVLAGDWTRNGFNAGCVEAAVMSGIQAANAIAGRPLDAGIQGPLASGTETLVAAAC